jgi:hypothetical protein
MGGQAAGNEPEGSMTKEERNEHWQSIIAEQEASGMTARAFCLQRHINPSHFYH